MSVSIEQLILDAKRVATRLKEREALGDSLLVETEAISQRIQSMKHFQDNIDALNKLARDSSNTKLIGMIHEENPHIWEMQQENRELRACLEDHQRALEHIMMKYREHTQKKILNSKMNFNEFYNTQKNEMIKKQNEKIQEMAAIMQRAASVDEDQINREQERLSKLVTENQGLRELLQISQKFGSFVPNHDCEDKCVQTDLTEAIPAMPSST